MLFQIYLNMKKMFAISNLPKYEKMYAMLCYLKEFRGFKYKVRLQKWKGLI